MRPLSGLPNAMRFQVFVSAAANKTKGVSQKKESTHAKLLSALSLADTQRVIEGATENYLSVGGADPLMARTSDASDWLSFADVTNQAQFSKVCLLTHSAAWRNSPLAKSEHPTMAQQYLKVHQCRVVRRQSDALRTPDSSGICSSLASCRLRPPNTPAGPSHLLLLTHYL